MKFYPVRDNGTVKIYALSATVPWSTHETFDDAKKEGVALCRSPKEVQQLSKVIEAEPYPLRNQSSVKPIKLIYSRD